MTGDSCHAARIPAAADLSAIATLWRAETLLPQVDLSAAEELLRGVPDPSPLPLGELVRARLAYARGQADAAVARYDAASAIGTDHDGPRLETAEEALAEVFRRHGLSP